MEKGKPPEASAAEVLHEIWTRRFRRRDFLKMAAAAVAGPSFLGGCFKKSNRRTLTFFNWSNYIGKKTIPDFERESGIRVQMDLYSDEEEMFAKLKTGVQGYDLTIATDYMVSRLKALDLIAPVPHDRLKNLGNLDPRFSNPVYDPGLTYTVPYLWGTTGIGYNKEFLKKPPASWWDLWDSKYKGRISMLDNARDGIGCALLMLGLSTDSARPQDLQRAKQLLVKQREILKQYSSSTYMDALIAGEVWLAQGWSGDVLQSARENPHVDYVIPQEGSFIWVDSFCLIHGSERREEALAFVDFVLRPDAAAEIADTMHYATPNAKAKALLKPDLLKDTRVFPSPSMEHRLRFYARLDEDAENLWNRTWQEVKVAG